MPLILSIGLPILSASCKILHLAAKFGARFSWRPTRVVALQYKINCKTPEEEARGSAAGDEKGWNEEEEAEADRKERVDQGGGNGEEKTCCKRYEECGYGEGSEYQQWQTSKGNL